MTDYDKRLIMEFNLLCLAKKKNAKEELLRIMDIYMEEYRDPDTGIFDPRPAIYRPDPDNTVEKIMGQISMIDVARDLYNEKPSDELKELLDSVDKHTDDPQEEYSVYVLYDIMCNDVPCKVILFDDDIKTVPASTITLKDEQESLL